MSSLQALRRLHSVLAEPLLARLAPSSSLAQRRFASGGDDPPSREGGSPENLPLENVDPNRVPPEGAKEMGNETGGTPGKGMDSPTIEELGPAGQSGDKSEGGGGEKGKVDAEGGGPPGGPSGRIGDSHTSGDEGVQRNARTGEFAPSDPAAQGGTSPEAAREAHKQN